MKTIGILVVAVLTSVQALAQTRERQRASIPTREQAERAVALRLKRGPLYDEAVANRGRVVREYPPEAGFCFLTVSWPK